MTRKFKVILFCIAGLIIAGCGEPQSSPEETETPPVIQETKENKVPVTKIVVEEVEKDVSEYEQFGDADSYNQLTQVIEKITEKTN